MVRLITHRLSETLRQVDETVLRNDAEFALGVVDEAVGDSGVVAHVLVVGPDG